jgi:amino-acid N-acetyltransferase
MIRKAKISDAKQIQALIQLWAKKGKMLERPLNYVYENIRDFWVFEADNKIVGCCALHIVGWESLAEIKSLAVAPKYQGRGIARALLESCLDEAKSLNLDKIFALTFVLKFFQKLGFKKTDRNKLPHKIWSDCINCTFFPDCHEEAVIINVKH